MARLNVRPAFTEKTHEGAPARHMTPMQALRRSVCSAMLWEREFYEDGEDIAARVTRLAAEVAPSDLAALAVEVRQQMKLRHMPLLLLSVLAEKGSGALVADTIAETIGRADELTEFLAIHAARNRVSPKAMKRVISAQMKKGLARAFLKFDEYQLAKYDRAGVVRLRDALFLCHAKPDTPEREALWKRLVEGNLVIPDTWEVALSGGADKCEAFTRLLNEGKLGYLAVLRNLRNMEQAGVDPGLVRAAILARKGAHNVLPFRYVAAARACPQMEPALDEALSESVTQSGGFPGRTIVLVDVSGSMDCALSSRSDLTRMDAAATLASVIYGDRRVFTFSHQLVEVPPRVGMAGVDAVIRSQPHGGTYLGAALEAVNRIPHDRLIVITDEQSHDSVGDPKAQHAYMINVASAQNGVGYGRWVHIDGFSENVLRFIHEHERAIG